MTHSSRRRVDRRRPIRAATLLASSFLGSFAAPAAAQPGAVPQAQERRVFIAPAGPATGLSAGRTVTLTIPAKADGVYLGDVSVTVDPTGGLSFSARRILDLLANLADPAVLRTLNASFAGEAELVPASFEASGIHIRYDPQALELVLEIAPERRAVHALQVAPQDSSRVGSYVRPAAISAYLNLRGNLDYLQGGRSGGLQAPLLYLDGAARAFGTVIESEGILQPGAVGSDFQRLGTRAVYDDTKNLMRWSAGDLQPVVRGFQAAPDVAGLSIFRSYSALQPQTSVRPRGERRFRLERPSTVEVQVNGQIVRRLQLQPGSYDLRDFPFTQGANDIRLSILDDAGRTEILRFNVFLDQSQLAKGLSEFGLYMGVFAPLTRTGPHYTSEPAITGFYRRGFSDYVTLGANLQADRRSRLGGLEGVFATRFGTVGVNLSASSIDGRGAGYGAILTFQRQILRGGGRADALNLSFETRSRNFGPMGTIVPDNPYLWEIGGGYSHAFSQSLYGGLDGRFSKGRDGRRDVGNLRGTLGWRASAAVSFTADARYERDERRSGFSALLSLTVRLGRYSNVRADYDSRDDRARLAYQTIHGQGVGSYNLSADVERNRSGAGANFTANYFSDRAEIGLSHYGTFSEGFGASREQRTSARLATSIAFADGAVSIGRPIYDSFAIVCPHPSLGGSEVVLDPTPFGYTASTGRLGTATEFGLSAYAERTVTVDVPSAPPGVDIGQGSFRLFPAYRSGYRLTVGSGFNVTALGRLVDRSGEPISLVAGQAVELAHPDRPPLALFTNRDGRFGATGLAPGKWRIEMVDEAKSIFVIEVPKGAKGVVRLGDVRAKDQ